LTNKNDDVGLIWALYVLLRPVNRNLALLAVFFRLVETTTACVAIISSYVAMQLISDTEHLKSFDSNQIQALLILHDTYALTFVIVAIFLGLGSTVFNYLLFKSRYIPRVLAAWGIFSSLLLLISQFTIIIFPARRKQLYLPVMVLSLSMKLLLVFGSCLRELIFPKWNLEFDCGTTSEENIQITTNR